MISETKHFLYIFILLWCSTISAQDKETVFGGQYTLLRIKPSTADATVKKWDTAHAVYYKPFETHNKLLIWLAGTNGTPNKVPEDFVKTALEKGYKVIALSYITVPAVAQVCVGERLRQDPDCAEKFREMRVFGDEKFEGIPDDSQDAIVPRLMKLLTYLEKNDPAGKWSQYINSKKNQPNWSKIALAGQSQGGGMSAYIAQHKKVNRIITFSGGWDYSDSEKKSIAGWYSKPNATPANRWFGTYHKNEIAAKTISQSYEALSIPDHHIFRLEEPLRKSGKGNNPYHGEGVHNPVYKNIWEKMLGNGKW